MSLLKLNPIAQLSKYAYTKGRLISLSSFRWGTVVPFKLSDIGEGIRDVTVKEWYVKTGDKVSQFDNICEVQSDKASVTITSRYDGIIKAIHYKVNETVLVGDALVDIELEEQEENKEISKNIEHIENEGKNEENEEKDLKGRKNAKRILTTPAVRRIAVENNIDLKNITATGKNNRVLKEDILPYLQKQNNNSSSSCFEQEQKGKTESNQIKNRNEGPDQHILMEGKIAQLKPFQKYMWKTMTRSLSIPHFGYSEECNVGQLIKYRNQVKEPLKEQGISLTLMPFLIKATSYALQQTKELNGWVDEKKETVKIFDRHNIGVAMDTPQGLVVPNVKDVQNHSIIDIARELNRLQELGRKMSIPLADLTNTTFSLSNIGVIGGTHTIPVITSPQVAIGAFGKVQKLPRFDEDGNVIAMNLITVSWAADHRVIDGVTLAKFSNLWRHYVENPTLLILGC